MTDEQGSPRTAEWAYRIIIGFIQGDDDQIESIFHEVYDDPADTGLLAMDLTKFLAATAGHLFIQRNGTHEQAIDELQGFLRDIALKAD